MDHNSAKDGPNYDGFLWVFPRKVVRTLYNAPGKEVSKRCVLAKVLSSPGPWVLLSQPVRGHVHKIWQS